MDNEAVQVDQIIKVLDVIVEGGNVSVKVKAATSAIGRFTAMLPMTDELLGLMSLSPKVLMEQVKDINPAEKQMISDHMKAKFKIPDGELEAQVESGLDLVIDTLGLVERCVKYAKTFTKKE